MLQRILMIILASSLVGCGGGTQGAPPHLILLTLDCMRPDRLAAYGGPVDVAPVLNSLAQKATVFSNAYTASGTTFPSHATMLTGLYPRMHGVRSNRYALADAFRTVPEILLEQGYRTGAFVSFRQMVVRGGLGQGFDTRSDTEDSEFSRAQGGLFRDKGIFRDGADTTRLAIEWIHEITEGPHQGPMLLWVHYYEPHAPYRLNNWSRKRIGDYQGPLADGVSIDELRNEVRRLVRQSERHRQALATLYDGEVHKMDAHIGELLATLRERGVLDDAVVIVASDHGQGLGEHGFTGHGPTVLEEVLRIPMFIVDFRDPKSRAVDTTVGAVDIGPTMLSLAGIEATWDWQGRDLTPALEGKVLSPVPYYAEVEYKQNDPGPWYHSDQIAVYDGGYKLAYNPEEFQLYDLDSDPAARHPLDPEAYPTVVDYLMGLAKDYLSRETEPQKTNLSAEDLETLKSLGYTQ